MDLLLYFIARSVVAGLQALPLRLVARIGRAGGALAYWLDARHRRVAVKNLEMCFAEKSPADIRAIAREHFRRLGENYASAIKTASMPWSELQAHVQFTGVEKFPTAASSDKPPSLVVAIGHFGNFELYACFGKFVPFYRSAATYRALRQPSLNRLMQRLREQSGCLFFERRTQFGELRSALSERGLILGLLADQHAGEGAVRLPFFGRDCSTTAAPAVLALRYGAPLYTGFCFRTGPAQWRLEAGDEIPTHEDGRARTAEDMMRDVNRAFEEAIRRDPANWFWVHNRWKPPRDKMRKRKTKKTASHSHR